MLRIFRLLVPASILAMFVCEAILIAGAYLAAVFFARGLNPRVFLIERSGWQSIAVAEGLIMLSMIFRQLYSDLRIQSRILLVQELSVVMGITFIGEALLGYFQSGWALPRDVLVPGSGVALAVVYAWRLLFSASLQNRLGMQRVLFIGLPPAAVQLSRYLSRHPEVGLAPVGYLGPVGPEHPLQRLGAPGDLRQAVELHQPEWIVVGERREISRSVDDLVELRFGGVRIEDVESFYERTLGRIHAAGIRSSELIFSSSLLPDPLNVRLQSIYATLVALFALPIAIPLTIVIAATVFATSRGSVLIRERRVGLGGVPFVMYRFCLWNKTMGIGRFLTRFGLDRLPQIWNVLRGEMSLVGPEPDRPEIADRLNQLIPFHSQRLLISPGVIGWAQIQQMQQGSRYDAIRRLEYDLYYMKNLSPLLDMFIVLRWLRDAIVFADRP